jgi:hypothetical protein
MGIRPHHPLRRWIFVIGFLSCSCWPDIHGGELMPGQRGSETRQLTKAVTVRIDNELAVRCADAASVVNLSVAGWLRRLAARSVRLEDEEARRSKPRAPVKPRPDELIHVLVALADRLAELAVILAKISAVQIDDDLSVTRSNLQSLLAETRSVSADVIAAIEIVVRR